MEQIILDVMNQLGYIGVFLLITIENVFPPIPSEIILVFSGFMTTYTSMTVPITIIVATLGSLCGAIILYYAGKILNRKRLKKLVRGKVGKYLGFKEAHIDKSINWFNKKGSISVLIGRCVPIIRSLISIPAGMSEMNVPKFLTLTTIGSLIWNTILVVLGSIAGNNWESIVSMIDTYSDIVLVILIIITIIFIAYFIYKRVAKKLPST